MNDFDDFSDRLREAADEAERERIKRREQRIEDLYGAEGRMARREVSSFTRQGEQE